MIKVSKWLRHTIVIVSNIDLSKFDIEDLFLIYKQGI